ncbi:hypothetical protein Tdes44962_MAKER03026 [Teratosphaeria destructans]|uniref:C2H2-type domain-containing protein n=1 Tax=Teratosphaeria destructans TaxID=418781 RepID=A0A9W7SRE2_9PEZI|nr:hypothetical protein Tdes44962_MAKER03026 [Teratosphaeria destructans]
MAPFASRKQKQARKVIDYRAQLIHSSKKSQYRLGPTSLQNAEKAWKRWTAFCEEHLDKYSLRRLQMWMHWCVNHSKIECLNSVFSTVRHWRMAYRLKLGHQLDPDLVSEMTMYIKQDLRLDFELHERRQQKGTANIDDLMILLNYHWSHDTSTFPTERHRVQLALVLLLLGYTGVRPSAVLEVDRAKPLEDADPGDDPDFLISARDADAKPDLLKYKDIEMYKVRGPGGQHLILMIITFRLMKNQRNKGLPPKFIFHERDDNLAFCVIMHVLSLAFADQAFKSAYMKQPDDLYRFEVDERRGLLSIPLEWREDMLDVPILRHEEPGIDSVRVSASKAWPYGPAKDKAAALGKAVGLKQGLQFYGLRRGAGEAINKHASTAVRNRAMGHSRSEIYDRFYTNQHVAADTMSAFIGTPSADWAIRLGSHMGLTRDPLAGRCVPMPSNDEVAHHEDVREVSNKLLDTKNQLLCTYGSIQKARKLAPNFEDYRVLQKEFRATQQRIRRALHEAKWKEWFANVGTSEIDRQRSGRPIAKQLPATPASLEERQMLIPLLCRNDDVSAVAPGEAEAQRRKALSLMIALCSRRELRLSPNRPKPAAISTTDANHADTIIDEGSFTALQCPWCFNDASLPVDQRTHRFSRLQRLQSHIETLHFRYATATTVTATANPMDLLNGLDHRCPFRSCVSTMPSEEMLKNHLALEHEVHCRAPRRYDFERDLLRTGDDSGFLAQGTEASDLFWLELIEFGEESAVPSLKSLH